MSKKTLIAAAPGARFLALGLLGALSLPVLAQPASEEQNDSEAREEREAHTLSEIRVSSGKADRTLRETYTSTSIFSGYELQNLDVTDLREAMRRQGNVGAPSANGGNTGIVIRGINSEGIGEPGGNLRPLTTLQIDGASQSFEGMRRGQRGTWDVKQVEVARGPQSTIQGRNALAGTISVETNDPTRYWEAAARYRASSLDEAGPAAMLSGPLTEALSFRVAAESMRGQKDIDYAVPANEFLDDDEYSNVRGKLLFEPRGVPELSAKLTVSDTTDNPPVTTVSGPDPYEREFNGTSTAAEERENDVLYSVADISYNLTPYTTLRSITARIDTDANLRGVGSISGAAYNRDEIRADEDTTQEIRLLHKNPNSDWSGLAGVFYGEFTNERDSLITIGASPFQSLESTRDDVNFGVFGEARWEFVENWTWMLGGRYSYDESESWFYNRVDQTITESRYESDAFLPSTGLIHDLSETSSVAFTVSQGYRAGFQEEGREIDPEYLTSYELAYRSEWLDRRLTLNANLFYYDWADQQVSVQDPDNPLVTLTDNVGESSVIGSEVDLRWHMDTVTVGGSVGLLKTRLEDYANPAGDGSFDGNEFPDAPRASGSLWVTSRLNDYWFVSGDMVARSDAYATGDLANREASKVSGYALFGLRLGYERDYYSVVVGVDNLFDREYLNGRDTLGGYYVGDPRTFSVTLNSRY